MSEEKTSLFEVLISILLGGAALGGGWAGYQSSQWGGTATEQYGKAATTSTRAATLFNLGVSIASRDSALDIQAKQLVFAALTETDAVAKARDMNVARYLYTQQMSEVGYKALGLPPEFYTKDRDKAWQISDEALQKGLLSELDDPYLGAVLKDGNDKFAEADQIFAEGQRVSGDSTKFALDGIFFTMSLFFGGMALVIRTKLRWGFLGAGYVALGYALITLCTLPWY